MKLPRSHAKVEVLLFSHGRPVRAHPSLPSLADWGPEPAVKGAWGGKGGGGAEPLPQFLLGSLIKNLFLLLKNKAIK